MKANLASTVITRLQSNFSQSPPLLSNHVTWRNNNFPYIDMSTALDSVLMGICQNNRRSSHPGILVSQENEPAAVPIQSAHGHESHILAPWNNVYCGRSTQLVRYRAYDSFRFVERDPLNLGRRPHEYPLSVHVYLVSSGVDLTKTSQTSHDVIALINVAPASRTMIAPLKPRAQVDGAACDRAMNTPSHTKSLFARQKTGWGAPLTGKSRSRT